ncbi:MAG: hypothetical protein NT121_02430 [Chloroflexi bacterium]|nr:hypothetical protein [Chloroflexota bacterium]
MTPDAETLKKTDDLPVMELPALVQIPEWELFPVEKRNELLQVLAEMLVKQVQALGVKHECPA